MNLAIAWHWLYTRDLLVVVACLLVGGWAWRELRLEEVSDE